MALPWVRMDTQWAQNPKFLMLAQDGKWRAVAVYWAALGWSGAQDLNGFIPYYALTQVLATKRQAAELVEVSLWHPCEGGWSINDFGEYQPAFAPEERERRTAKARDAAFVRWHGRNGQKPQP